MYTQLNNGKQHSLEIPPQSLSHAEMHAGLHVKFLSLLTNFNQNWNLSTYLSTISDYRIS